MQTYPVGWNRTYTTIQAALDAIESDLGGGPPAEPYEVRIYDSRMYTGFRVPFMGFHPATPLWIRADEGASPAVSGFVDKASSWLGIDMGHPDTGIFGVFFEGLTIHGFSQAVLMHSAHECLFRRCHFVDNSLYSVRMYRCGGIAFHDCTFQNSRIHLAILQSTSNIILVHNTLDTVDPDGNCVWADWQSDSVESGTSGAQVFAESGGKIVRAINNIFVSRGRPCLSIHRDLQGTWEGDGNVYWSDVGNLASIYEYVDGVRADTLISSMYEWRRMNEADENSAFTDPQLLTIPGSGRFQEDGALGPTSPAIAIGVEVDTSESGNIDWSRIVYEPYDVNGTLRSGPSNSGTIEYPIHQDYDYLGFLDLTSDYQTTDPTIIYGADRAARQLAASVEPWHPLVKSGHFFLRDNAYYLFAQKGTEYLSAFRWRVVTLDVQIEVDSVYIDDVPVEWMWRGGEVWACENGATLTDSSIIRVHGKQRDWNTDTNGFDEANVSYEFPLYEQPVEHFFPSDPVDGAPVVITDDSINPNVPRTLLPFEYSIAYDDSMQRYRLKIQGEKNLFRSPHFDSGDGWTISPDADVISDTSDVPFAGFNVLRYSYPTPAPTSEYLSQEVYRAEEDSDLVLSFYVRKNSVGDHVAKVQTFLDDGSVFAEEEFPFVPEYDGSLQWTRYVLYMKAGASSTLLTHGAAYDVLLGSTSLETVDGGTTRKVKFSIEGAGPATSEASGFMAFEGNYVPRYAGVPDPSKVTVEFETSDKQLCQADLSISPIINPFANGFLTVGPLPATLFDSVASPTATTLNDEWPALRFDTLPWAKLDGPGKLSRTPYKGFRVAGVGLPWEVAEQPPEPVLDRLVARPDPVVVRQGGEAAVVISALDKTGNPWIYRQIDATLDAGDSYPGLLGLRELSSPSVLDTSVEAISDTAGRVVLNVIAPAQEMCRVAVALGDLDVLVETPYHVNLEHNGNITFRNPDTLDPIDIIGPATSETVTAEPLGAYAYADLSGRPAFGTVRVKVDGDGELDMELRESMNPLHERAHFYLNYETRILSIPSEFARALITYEPYLAWPQASGEGVVVDATLVASVTSDVVVDYDAMATLHFSSGGVTSEVGVVYQNPDL